MYRDKKFQYYIVMTLMLLAMQHGFALYVMLKIASKLVYVDGKWNEIIMILLPSIKL